MGCNLTQYFSWPMRCMDLLSPPPHIVLFFSSGSSSLWSAAQLWGELENKIRSSPARDVCDRSETTLCLLICISRRPSEVPPATSFEKDNERKEKQLSGPKRHLWLLLCSG